MRTLLALALFLALCGCQVVVGNGQLTTTPREVPAFRRLSVSDALNVTATTGARGVAVSADENLQSYIEVLVEGDVLVIRARRGVSLSSKTPIQATVSNNLLEAVDASGASNVTANVTPVETLRVSASGSSHVTLNGVSSTTVVADASGSSDSTFTGAASTAELSGSGSSDLRLRDLTLGSATIHLSGSSTLWAQISGSVSGDASGASSAFITGTPTSSVQLSGSSKLTTGEQ